MDEEKISNSHDLRELLAFAAMTDVSLPPKKEFYFLLTMICSLKRQCFYVISQKSVS